MSQNEIRPINKKRLGCCIAYFTFAVLCFIWILLRREEVFYTDLDQSTWHLYRLLWCVFATLLGFASVAFGLRRHPTNPFPAYLTYYPAQISIVATATHGLLHCFEATSGFVFYYLALSICFYCGYNIDGWQKKIRELLGRS